MNLRYHLKKLIIPLAKKWPYPVGVRLKNGMICYVDLRSGVGGHIFLNGDFDPLVFKPFREALSDGGTFLDVGANVGFYSLLALEIVGPTGRVHAFEVDSRPLACLEKTIKINKFSNLLLHATAISNVQGSAKLIQMDDCGHNRVLSEESEGALVKVETLDALNELHGFTNIQGIKIDVEGAELMVLKGARALLERQRPVVVLEADNEHANIYNYNINDILEFFKDINYKAISLEGCWDSTLLALPNK